MKTVLAIATTGRPAVVGDALARVMRLARTPDAVLIVGAAQSDAPARLLGARFAVAPAKGLCAQRNHALDLIGDDADIIIFIDDDYVPAPGFIEGAERLFVTYPDIVAASGELIADGINRGGLTFEEADALIAAYVPAQEIRLRESTGTYGCNMAYRRAAAPHLRFDETLPLYGWLEDTDFSARYARHGRVVRTNHFAGVVQVASNRGTLSAAPQAARRSGCAAQQYREHKPKRHRRSRPR